MRKARRYDIEYDYTSFPILPLMIPPLMEAINSNNSSGVSFMSFMVNFSFFMNAAISLIIQLAADFASAPFARVESKNSAI
jgi:hypothetical protein